MKEDYLRIRMSKRRMDKLRLYGSMKDTTMTHVIEDLIDSLDIPETANQGTVPFAVPASSEIDSRDVP